MLVAIDQGSGLVTPERDAGQAKRGCEDEVGGGGTGWCGALEKLVLVPVVPVLCTFL